MFLENYFLEYLFAGISKSIYFLLGNFLTIFQQVGTTPVTEILKVVFLFWSTYLLSNNLVLNIRNAKIFLTPFSNLTFHNYRYFFLTLCVFPM